MKPRSPRIISSAPTLDEALSALFGKQQPQTISMQGRAAQTTGAAAKVTTGQLDVGQARMQFQDAQKAMQQGDWDKFGKAMEALKRLLANPLM